MSSHQCGVSAAVNKIPMSATRMSHPGRAQVGSIRKAKAWAALAKAAAFLGCQQRAEAIPRPWRNWEVSALHPPHPHSAEVSLFKATSHHQHMEGLQGFAFWMTARQIWLASSQLKFLSNTEISLDENNISSLSKPVPLSWLALSLGRSLPVPL